MVLLVVQHTWHRQQVDEVRWLLEAPTPAPTPTPSLLRCDLFPGIVLKTLTDKAWVDAVAADFDKQLAISGSYDRTVKVWDLSTGTVLNTLTDHRGYVLAVAADFDKQLAISGSSDKTLKVWDLSTGAVLKTLTGHRSSVCAVAADFDKQLAISGSYDTTQKVWDLSTGAVLKTLTGHRDYVQGVAADFDKQLAISASSDSTLKVWRLCKDTELIATSSGTGLLVRTSNILKPGTSAQLAANLREKTAQSQDMQKKLADLAKSEEAELEAPQRASAAKAHEVQDKVLFREGQLQEQKEAKKAAKDIEVAAEFKAAEEAEKKSAAIAFAEAAKQAKDTDAEIVAPQASILLS